MASQPVLTTKSGEASLIVNQTSHGFSVKDVLYHDGTNFAKALADSEST